MKENTNESNNVKSMEENLKDVAKNVGKVFSSATDTAKSIVIKSKDSIVNAVDANGNGEIISRILLLLVCRLRVLR